MNTLNVFKKAVITEKTDLLAKKSIYVFLVENNTTKNDVAKAIKKHFSQEAIKINMTKFAPKTKRVGKTKQTTKVGGGKKAVVWLKPGQKIDLFTKKAEKKGKSSKKDKEKNK